ncbi:hypothetical protein SDC9_81222 [bioreactor metagenome]|uniref:DUF112 domain-containing protein n=1 Tax=bioreactor metagenome TaxID=1076179 RepID=A0A644Z161_9ZZZZ
MLANIGSALMNMLDFTTIFAMAAGLAVGVSFGAMPGLNATIGITLLLPFTFGMSPAPAMLMLIGVYCGATYAGSISAILINTPGTAAASATVLDGYPMNKQGKANIALSISLRGSVIGGLFSGVCLLFFAPQLAKIALKFGAPDYFMLTVFGLSIIASVSGKSILKGVAMAGLGLLVTTIGIDPQQGVYRLTFGSNILTRGVDLVPALIGLFAISELFSQAEQKVMFMTRPPKVGLAKSHGWKDMFKYKWLMLKSSIIGVIVGITPGTGAAIAAFLSYGEAKRASKHPESFGNGSEEGLCAAETANNAVTGATLIPMLTLGIPGDSVTAVLMGALAIHGLSPGTELFTKYADMTYVVLVGFIIVQILLFYMGKLAIRGFSQITRIPYYILLPMVLGFCLVGAYSCSNNTTDILVAIIFGVIGYVAPKFGFPSTPMLIGIVLGSLAEKNLVRTMAVYSGNLGVFVTRPISLFFLILSIVSVGFALLQNHRSKAKNAET